MKGYFRILILLMLFGFSGFSKDIGSIDHDLSKSGNVHVISIGVNDYPGTPLRLCVSDSEDWVAKLKYDISGQAGHVEEQPVVSTVLGKTLTVDYGRPGEYNIEKMFVQHLHDGEATLDNIRHAFKTLISNSSVNDYFIFFFSGFNWDNETRMTFLMPNEALRRAILKYKTQVNNDPKYLTAFSIFGVPY